MADLLDKLSSYNLFNYLFPGIIFVVLAESFTQYSFIQKDIVIGLFLYYFIGLVVSRLGSLIIEPLLKKFSIIKFSEYNDYIEASKKDVKIELLSEVNNTYRTFCSLFMLLLFLKLYEWIQSIVPILKSWDSTAIIVLLFVIFVIAYRKQTNYITDRIKKVLNITR